MSLPRQRGRHPIVDGPFNWKLGRETTGPLSVRDEVGSPISKAILWLYGKLFRILFQTEFNLKVLTFPMSHVCLGNLLFNQHLMAVGL